MPLYTLLIVMLQLTAGNAWECLFQHLSIWVFQFMHFTVVSKEALTRIEVCIGL